MPLAALGLALACAAGAPGAGPLTAPGSTSPPPGTTTASTLSTDPCAGNAVVEDVELAPHPEDPLQHDASFTVTPAADLHLRCEAMDDPAEALSWTVPAGDPVAHMRGLRPRTDYLCEVTPTCPAGEPLPFAVSVGAAPTGTPLFEVEGDPEAGPPFVLLNHQSTCDGTREERLVLVDRWGNPRWVHTFEREDDPGLVARWEAPDRVFAGGAWRPERLDLDHAVRWRGTFEGDEAFGFHHDARALPDGSVLVLGRTEGRLDGEAVQGFTVYRFDAGTGEISLAFDALEAAADGQLDRGTGEDPWHANWLDLADLGDGERVLVGLCHADAIVAIDPADGSVAWRLGRGGDFTLLGADGQPLDADGWPSCLHGPGVAGHRVVLFDNGLNPVTGADLGRSRILDWTVDAAARTVTERHAWTEDGFYETVWGDADPLEDGRILVTRGHWECASPSAGARSEVFVLDPETGEVPWRLRAGDPLDGFYRAEIADACAAIPQEALCGAS